MTTPQARNTRPTLDGARCVHAAIEIASCRACVAACPRGALRLDDAALEFDGGLCDGCGLCVPACPRQAIDLPLVLASLPMAGTNAMLAACDHTGDKADCTAGPGHIACLHAIGLAELLRAYHAGQRVWLLARGDCTHCPRGRVERLSTRVTHLNTALRQRGLRPIILREVSRAAWIDLFNTEAAAATQARRSFFRALSRQPTAVLFGVPTETRKAHAKPPGEYLPEGDDALMPWVIHLDATRCVGCHACARICPENAIQFHEADPAYHLRHRACTGCGLCQDVCPHQAVTLQPWTEPAQWIQPLVAQRCPSCGVVFDTPAGVSVNTRVCWVCAGAKQQRRLYQVFT